MPTKANTKTTAPAARRRKTAGAAPAKAANHGWPSGLEAIAKAQQEGVKVFETLLKKGQRFEQKTREAAADTAAAARDTAMAARGAAAAKAKEVQQMAGGTWDKLEQVFEDRVERALSKLGIYTQNDLQRLAARVDELAEAVNRLLAAKAVPAKSPGTGAKRPAKRARKTASR
jgi:poly(hydroxyalkanoate) granule-associated protein